MNQPDLSTGFRSSSKSARFIFLLLAGCALMFCAAFSAPLEPAPAGKVIVAKVACSNQAAAYASGLAYAAAHGGSVIITSGTPSMEPLIHGRTYAVIQNRPYESIQRRDLLVYMGRPNAAKPTRLQMLHRAVKGDRYGWIMSGDNNRWSESWDRVTPKTYVGTVVALFAFPAAGAGADSSVAATGAVSPR